MPRQASSTNSSHDDLSESLVALKSYIHALVVISRIIRWKPYNGDGHSAVSAMFLTLTMWSALYYDHRLCLSTAVPLFVAYLATQPTREHQTGAGGNDCSSNESKDDDGADNDGKQLQAVITELAELARLLPSSWPKLSMSPSVGFLLYVAWQCVIYTSSIKQCLWLVGWGCFMWCNPWVSKMRSIIAMSYYEYRRRPPCQNKQEQLPVLIPTTSSKKSEIDRLYCFCIYEHQRWWVHTGWSPLMLPRDRPGWSDEYLEPTPSAGKFGLPPPVSDQVWTWTDPQWKVEDWEYANWNWEGWDSKPSIKALTRRRRWIRCAHLEKRPLDAALSAPAAEDTAIPDSDSNYSSSPSLLFFPTSRRSSSLLTHTTLSSVSTIVSHC